MGRQVHSQPSCLQSDRGRGCKALCIAPVSCCCLMEITLHPSTVYLAYIRSAEAASSPFSGFASLQRSADHFLARPHEVKEGCLDGSFALGRPGHDEFNHPFRLSQGAESQITDANPALRGGAQRDAFAGLDQREDARKNIGGLDDGG